MAFISLTEIYNTPLADSTANYLAYLFETSDKTEELQYLFSVKVLDRRHYVQIYALYNIVHCNIIHTVMKKYRTDP